MQSAIKADMKHSLALLNAKPNLLHNVTALGFGEQLVVSGSFFICHRQLKAML